MRRVLPLVGVIVCLLSGNRATAHGLLIPDEKTLPPLAMLNHKVEINIEDQVAVTRVEQTFRNHTDRELEATYVFPVPKGASVNKFSMWVGTQKVDGELIQANEARAIYQSIVKQSHDPGLVEYMGNDLLRMRVYPIAPKGDQKVAIQFTSVADKEKDLVEYVYPLKTDGKATATLEQFSITATIKSQHGIQNVYSPTHSISLRRTNDKEVVVTFDRNQGLLDKDFQIYYSLGAKDIGLTAMMTRPISTENGYFMAIISPKVEIPEEQIIPRDIVFVLDTSGSMRGQKLAQAKKALVYCLNNLSKKDRFALMNFATTVNPYKDGLLDANKEQIEAAVKWVEKLEVSGGTAINDAILAALDLRSKDDSRVFNVAFFTDGEPTVGERRPEKIIANVVAKNTANTRIFTFGVGYGSGANDKLNASLLDGLAEQTRGFATFVRPEEDIESKVSAMYSKISNPVLTNLKLTVSSETSEIYPPQLPDLFQGGQLIVLGRYTGTGSGTIKLTGMVGKEKKEFTFDTNFAEKTGDEHAFVEHLWARRKVGYMLDQIRVNGENKELVDEIVKLAKKYSITTPYTSFLIVPDGAIPVVGGGGPRGKGEAGGLPPVLLPTTPGAKPESVEHLARRLQDKPGDLERNRDKYADDELKRGSGSGSADAKVLQEAKDKKDAYDKAREAFKGGGGGYRDSQSGKLGVDLSIQTNNLRCQTRMEQTAYRNVNGRNCLEIGGVWIDEGFDQKMTTVTVKAQSDAYFRILEKQPKMKDVFRLANHIVWVTPNGTALIIDTSDGKEKLDDKEIEELFTAKK
jgi:Ca-activated chloride channel homolog